MILEKSKIKYKLSVTKSEYEDFVKLYGQEGNIQCFFQLARFNGKLNVYEIYFTKLEYKFYKQLLKEKKSL